MKRKKYLLFALFVSVLFVSNTKIQKVKGSVPPTDVTIRNSKSLTTSFLSMTDEELSKRFGGMTESAIDEMFEGRNESDEVVALSSDGMIIGSGNVRDFDDSKRKVIINSETDPNAISIKDLKIFIKEWLNKKGKLQVQVSHPDKPVSACCN